MYKMAELGERRSPYNLTTGATPPLLRFLMTFIPIFAPFSEQQQNKNANKLYFLSPTREVLRLMRYIDSCADVFWLV